MSGGSKGLRVLVVVCASMALLAPVCGFSSSPKTEIEDILAALEGLAFDEFIDASYKEVLKRSPESVTSLGLSEELGMRDDRLDNACNDFAIETYELEEGILELLQGYDRESLSYEQQVSYDSYTWILEGWLEERNWMYHFYPVHHGFSRQNELFRFFSDEHPLVTPENVEDYISRLDQIDDQLACLESNMAESEARGIMAPAQMLQMASERISWVVPGVARNTPFYTNLLSSIGGVEGLTLAERQQYLRDAEQAINESVIPAYQSLVAAIDEQVPLAPPMNGVWQLPDGDAFYTSRVRHHTTTNQTPAEIHERGLEEVERIRAEIRSRFDDLGYPGDSGFQELFLRVGQDSGVVLAEDIVPYNEDLIRQAQRDSREVFDIEPATEVIIIGGAGGGFYVAGSLDGSRPGAYYIGNQQDTYRYWMPTILYHEAVPGHHFQISIGAEQDVPLFTKGGGFYTGYVEGWALYAEKLASELGWYDDDIYGELGRLQWELLRAGRLVVDTGLHHFRWSPQQAIDYYVNMVGTSIGQATGQINLYLYYVGYFTAYKTGELKILELRQRARDELGELFDIKEFHRTVLVRNRLPLPLLERLVDDYIDAKLNPPRLPAPVRVRGTRVAIRP